MPVPCSVSGGILVVDDHSWVLQVLLELLRLAFPQHTVRGAASAKEAIVLCRSAMPQVVVMDIMLKEESGLHAVREIRLLDERVKVVMHSSHDDELVQQASMRAGAVAFVSKRDASQLVPAVGRLLQAHSPEDSRTPR